LLDNSCDIWFKFITISNLLNYKNRKDALRDLISKDNKKKLKEIKTLIKIKEHPNTIYINESGLYNFLIRSRMKNARNFQLWLSNDVLPKLRKQGKYELDKKVKFKVKNLNKKIKILEHNNKLLKKNLTKNKYPKGTHVYVIEDEKLYKIGYTSDLKKRIQVYNTGKANKATYAYYKKTNCGYEIELCMKAILNKYIYKSNKEFYNCDLDKIINSIIKCIKIENKCKKCDDINQIGGSINLNITDLLIKYYTDKLNYYIEIDKEINLF
jgi:prophage antirepressor-like protein